jgi:hypothetical protein
MSTAVVVLADPAGGDDAAGRVFNALAATSDLRRDGEDVRVIFQGAGTRWAALLANPEHPFHELFATVRPSVAGVSEACSAFFGAKEAAVAAGFDLVRGNPVGDAGELPSLARMIADGCRVLTF